MKPIEKNVIVIDEQGKEYEATYPKRAKGLVKNGRARFVDENTICLACPPEKNSEDLKMDENINEKVENTKEENSVALTIDYVLKQIEKIMERDSHVHEALNSLVGIYIDNGCGDIANQSKADAIAEVVKSRETTNQQLLKLYEKMYDDLKTGKQKPQNQDKIALFNDLKSSLSGSNFIQDEFSPAAIDILKQSIQQIFRIN